MKQMVLKMPEPAMPEEVTPVHLWLEVESQLLKAKEIVHLKGQAPRGEMERKVQQWLEEQSQ
eukprot:11181093-Karenia_brevis.AAC.1